MSEKNKEEKTPKKRSMGETMLFQLVKKGDEFEAEKEPPFILVPVWSAVETEGRKFDSTKSAITMAKSYMIMGDATESTYVVGRMVKTLNMKTEVKVACSEEEGLSIAPNQEAQEPQDPKNGEVSKDFRIGMVD